MQYVRIPRDRAAEWAERVEELIEEFIAEPRSGETVYGLAVAPYPTLPPTSTGSPDRRSDTGGRSGSPSEVPAGSTS